MRKQGLENGGVTSRLEKVQKWSLFIDVPIAMDILLNITIALIMKTPCADQTQSIAQKTWLWWLEGILNRSDISSKGQKLEFRDLRKKKNFWDDSGLDYPTGIHHRNMYTKYVH